jgi:hypothetical protein
MLAIVVGSVVGTLAFSWSCRTGHGDAALPVVFFFLIFPCTWVAHSRSSFSTIGFFIAALSPFSMVKECPAPELASSSQNAQALWGGIRARSIAMFILTVCEFVFMERKHSRFSADYFDNAMKSIESAFALLWDGKDPKSASDDAKKGTDNAISFGAGAKVEPRFGGCEWKKEFLEDCCDAIACLRVDVMMTYRGMGGVDGNAEKISALLKGAAGFKLLQDGFDSMLEAARVMTNGVLLHTNGEHKQLAAFETMSEMDELAELDKAIADLNACLKFPDKAPDTMENDQICQLALMIAMLQLAKTHVAAIVRSGLKHT